MRSRGVLLTMLAVFIAGVVFSLSIIPEGIDMRLDMVMANDVLKTVEKNWERIEQVDYSGITQQFAVLDQEGLLRYQTADGMFTGLNDAIRNRDAILDVTVQGVTAGKLIIREDYSARLQQNKQQLVTVITVSFCMMLVLGGLYVFYLQHAFISPFKKLQGFARNVARGNLELPLSMNKNNPFGVFTESFDIMREQLAAARKSEYEANRSKKELVASLSHDIKTPVASIKAVSELMLLRAMDAKDIRQLNMINAKAEQIDLMVTDMFHATLEELQELKVKGTEEYSSILDDILQNADLDNRIFHDPIPECMIYADALRLQQVFDNILSNSYKYANTAVTVVTYLTSGYLQIDIMDYGKGVDPDELPLLFNKFYRGQNITGQAGAGLGLYISKYLMQGMQGEIECSNREGGFTVSLRLKLV
ncbi:HAMP domain-containing sensor histidine kinase [Paenibacillus sp. FSL L8-0436]|uniref:HAMP domain-containing sensor histidine kinase n=1 Tax=Paenibacillus sp. FSL L8-0436 TaxID=2954686 RepID=UPI003158E286